MFVSGATSMEVRHADTEESLWKILEELLSIDGDNTPFEIDFSSADWAKTRIKYYGKPFHQSLTPSTMKGLIELQNSLYRASAAILREEPDARRLTETEKARLELIFKIGKGSTPTEGDGKGILTTLNGAIAKMTSRHLLIGVCVLGLSYFGEKGYESHLGSLKDEKAAIKDEKVAAIPDEIMKHDERMAELLVRGREQSPAAAAVQVEANRGFQSVIRNSGDASSLEIQKVPISRQQIEESRRKSRRTSSTFEIRQEFELRNVDPRSPDGFTVLIKSKVDGLEFKATLYDSIASDKDKELIREAEWGKKGVILRIIGTKVGNTVTSARIIKASAVANKT